MQMKVSFVTFSIVSVVSIPVKCYEGVGCSEGCGVSDTINRIVLSDTA